MFTQNCQAVVEKQCPDVSIEMIQRETANVLFNKHLSYMETILVSNRRMPATLKTNSLGNIILKVAPPVRNNTKLQWFP